MKLHSVKLPSNKTFGFFFAAIFIIIGVYFLSERSFTLTKIFFGMSGLLLAITSFKAELLLPANKFWAIFGHLLGMIISPIVLGIIFFGLFTPIAVCTRLFGRDELQLKLLYRATFWKSKELSVSASSSFKNQF